MEKGQEWRHQEEPVLGRGCRKPAWHSEAALKVGRVTVKVTSGKQVQEVGSF